MNFQCLIVDSNKWYQSQIQQAMKNEQNLEVHAVEDIHHAALQMKTLQPYVVMLRCDDENLAFAAVIRSVQRAVHPWV